MVVLPQGKGRIADKKKNFIDWQEMGDMIKQEMVILKYDQRQTEYCEVRLAQSMTH